MDLKEKLQSESRKLQRPLTISEILDIAEVHEWTRVETAWMQLHFLTNVIKSVKPNMYEAEIQVEINKRGKR